MVWPAMSERGGPAKPAARESNGGSAWESNPLRTLSLKDLQRFRIVQILRFLSVAAVNPPNCPQRREALDTVPGNDRFAGLALREPDGASASARRVILPTTATFIWGV